MADQRPILGLEAAVQRDEPGTVGIRQISTPSGLWRMTAIALSINLPSALHCEARLDAAR